MMLLKKKETKLLKPSYIIDMGMFEITIWKLKKKRKEINYLKGANFSKCIFKN